ncbi:hypothetical protein GCM10010211_61540 [Streptomyces albospinus]|uniref:Tc1-like transposase DDE domain-containing protein n=1 Tax=Streptomyces albospinus TaxID=285515 RepID=A0ABQ2VID7_9ACTN|nr:transposase [Streptomyces albospinus]GGU87072.1 hypothetical protein GCM10010211_61540 [Streptomyces albospinus]
MRELITAGLLLTVCQLPPHAPELNPVEGRWSHLKRSLANLTKHSLDQLTALVKTPLNRMQYRPTSSRASSPRPDSASNRRDLSRYRSLVRRRRHRQAASGERRQEGASGHRIFAKAARAR